MQQNLMMVILTNNFWSLLVFYTGFESISVNCTWWGRMCQSSWRSVQCLKIWGMPIVHLTSKSKFVDQLLLCILLFCPILELLILHMVWSPKSCSRSYVHFCVPWILYDFSNDPWTGTTNDFDCCLHWISGHVDKCSIARPWSSWGLVGWDSLPSHL